MGMDLCFTVALSTFCLVIPLLLCYFLHTLCSIISSTLPPPSTELRCLAAHLSHLAMQYCSSSLAMTCGSTRNLIDSDGLTVAHFCQTDIYGKSHDQCNVP